MSRGYIPSLDGIRAVSIALVFVAHVGWGHVVPGGFGVTIFFFLSGYLITTLLFREYETSGRISLNAFYLRRVFRLGPPLLLTMAAASLLVVTGLAEGDLDPATFASQIFFYYNYWSLSDAAGSSVEGLGILWSLAVEEHFYLVWPSIFLLIARKRISSRHVLIGLSVILLWRVVRFYLLGHSAWDVYISTDTRIDSILFGCLLAMIVNSGAASRFFPDGVAARYLVMAVAIIVLLLCFVVREEGFRSTLRYTLQGLALMPLFYYAIFRPEDPLFRWLNGRVIRRIGVYSYTIYLCHFVIIYALERTELETAARVILALALSIGWAALVNELVEKPLKPLRTKLHGFAAPKTT